ncbi:unnamed protein product, partial [Staurois parvus]
PPNHWIQVFQSPPWPQVYKIKPKACRLLLQTFVKECVALRSSVNSSMVPVIGCHLCNKSICEISLLLNIPRSTVSGIITKWKQLGTTATQPQSGRSRKMTEWNQHMLKRTVHKSHQLS